MKELSFQKLADACRKHLDISKILKIMEQPVF
jgi:hypothetical protein